ncbi:hypothetical protein BG005_001115 [Podila minutissima]|nr:hypothetical protein BG005_001115 [Podila minutissima]
MSATFICGSTERQLGLVSSTDSHKTHFIHVDDVLAAFKDLAAFKNLDAVRFEVDGRTIAYMRDDNGTVYDPKRIPCRPGWVIEVVLKTPQPDSACLTSTIAPVSRLSLNEPVDPFSIETKVSTDFGLSEPMSSTVSRRTTTHIHGQLKTLLNAAVEVASRSGRPLNAEVVQDLIGKHLVPPTYGDDIQQYLVQNVDMLVRDLSLQRNVLEQLMHKMIDMQQQALDRLALIERKTEAILTQNYELLEYTVPRLFIVLPETTTSWDPKTMLRTKFRLHFICECGDHTKVTGSKIPHHLHLANHEGYVINKPTEFFEKYGPFLMLMLKLIKVGVSTAGIVVPALSSLKVVDILDSTQSAIDSVTSKVIEGVDYSLAYLEKSRTVIQRSDDGEARTLKQDLSSYLAGVEGVEGVDLRQLGSYLAASSSDNLLGNLYRMTTKDGHVKWVCRDHYRAGYQEALSQKLRDVVNLNGGEFDEQLGRIEITLESRAVAAEFYHAICKAKGVLDLDVKLNWNQEYAAFVELKDMVSTSNIRSIAVHLYCHMGPKIDIKHIKHIKHIKGRRYDPISDTDITKLKQLVDQAPNLSSLSLETPEKFFEGSSPWPSKTIFSNLGQLAIGQLDSDTDIVKLKLLVAQAPNLSSLSLETPQGFFERYSPWQRNDDFSNLRHLAIGRLDSDMDIAKLKQLVAQAPHLASLSLETSKGFFKRCSPWPMNADFSTLRHLAIGQLDSDEDIVNLKQLVAKASKISSLTLDVSWSQIPAVFSSIAEYQTYPIIFPSRSLRVLPPRSELHPSRAGFQDLTRLSEFHGAQLETLVVRCFWWGDSAMEALIEAPQDNSSLKGFSVVRQVDDKGVKDLDGAIAQSELHRLEIHLGEEGDVTKEYSHVRIPESILWQCIRELYIEERRASPGMEMEALVDSMEKMSESVKLADLSYNARDIPEAQWKLLLRIVSLVSLKSLDLLVSLTCEQVHDLFELMDISDLQYFVFWNDEWDSDKVQTVLNALQHAPRLRTIYLPHADFTEQQKKQMPKRIELRSQSY